MFISISISIGIGIDFKRIDYDDSLLNINRIITSVIHIGCGV